MPNPWDYDDALKEMQRLLLSNVQFNVSYVLAGVVISCPECGYAYPPCEGAKVLLKG